MRLLRRSATSAPSNVRRRRRTHARSRWLNAIMVGGVLAVAVNMPRRPTSSSDVVRARDGDSNGIPVEHHSVRPWQLLNGDIL